MDGFSAVVGVAQVLNQGITVISTLLEIRERIRESPERFERYARMVNQLMITAEQIQQNPTLQTRQVHVYLSATSVEITAAQQVLDKFTKASRSRRAWRVISGRLQRRIVEHLDNLHHTISEFCLYIASLTTIRMDKVQGSLDQIMDLTKNLTLAGRQQASTVSLLWD
jgi:hypothetical protein